MRIETRYPAVGHRPADRAGRDVLGVLDSALPLAVSRAGGLGVIAAGPMRLADLEHAIDEVAPRPTARSGQRAAVPQGGADEVLELLERKRVPVLIASQGGPQRYLARFARSARSVCTSSPARSTPARLRTRASTAWWSLAGKRAGTRRPAWCRRWSSSAPWRVPSTHRSSRPAASPTAPAWRPRSRSAQGPPSSAPGSWPASRRACIPPTAAVLQAPVADTRTVGRELGMIRALANDSPHAWANSRTTARPTPTAKPSSQASLKAAALHGDVEGGKVEAGQTAGLIGATLPAAEIVGRLAASTSTHWGVSPPVVTVANLNSGLSQWNT